MLKIFQMSVFENKKVIKVNLRIRVVGVHVVVIHLIVHPILHVGRIVVGGRHSVRPRPVVAVAQRVTHRTITTRTVTPVHYYLPGRSTVAHLNITAVSFLRTDYSLKIDDKPRMMVYNK